MRDFRSKKNRLVRVHDRDGNKVGCETSEVTLCALCSFTNSLLPDKKESEEDEVRGLDYLVGNIKIHVSWGFGFEKASALGDSAVRFYDDGLCVTVHKLKEVSGFDSEGG